MRKTLPYLLLSCILFFSCKKEHEATLAKKYKITYNLSGFTQQIISSANNRNLSSLHSKSFASGLAGSADFLYYRVYDFNTGAVIHQINQDSSMTNFGNLSDDLPAGKYVIAFVTSKHTVTVNSAALNNGAGISVPATSTWPDTFYSLDTLTVNNTDATVNTNLHRIVGQLTLNFLDIFPAAAYKLNVIISQEYHSFSITGSSAAGGAPSLSLIDTIPATFKTTAGYKPGIFMINDTGPFTVTVICYDVSNRMLAQAVISNVSIQRNTQTVLTGSLFATGAGFNVGLNLPFDPSEINVSF
jgi:hypothetical protein